MSKGKKVVLNWRHFNKHTFVCVCVCKWTYGHAAGGMCIVNVWGCVSLFSDRCNDTISPLAVSSSVWSCYSDCGLGGGIGNEVLVASGLYVSVFLSLFFMYMSGCVCEIFMFICLCVSKGIKEKLICVIWNLIKTVPSNTHSITYTHRHTHRVGSTSYHIPLKLPRQWSCCANWYKQKKYPLHGDCETVWYEATCSLKDKAQV